MDGRAWITELSYADLFPGFVDERAYAVYCRTRLFNLKPVDLVMSALPLALLATVSFATRCSLQYIPDVNPVFSVALAVTLFTFFLCYVFVATLMCKMCLATTSWLYHASNWFLYHSWLPRAVYDRYSLTSLTITNEEARLTPSRRVTPSFLHLSPWASPSLPLPPLKARPC